MCRCEATVRTHSLWGCEPPTVALTSASVTKIDATVRVAVPGGASLVIGARSAASGHVLDVGVRMNAYVGVQLASDGKSYAARAADALEPDDVLCLLL